MRSNEQFDEFYGNFLLKFHEILSELNNILFLFFKGHFDSYIFKSVFVIFFILDQYLEIEFIFVFLLCQSHGFFKVIEIFANFDGCFNIKQITF